MANAYDTYLLQLAGELGRPVFPVEVSYLRAEGCCLTGDGEFIHSDEIWLELIGIGVKRGSISWRSGREAAIRFNYPIEHSELKKLTAGPHSAFKIKNGWDAYQSLLAAERQVAKLDGQVNLWPYTLDELLDN